jgi:methionine-rich copper-binding protein CopC
MSKLLAGCYAALLVLVAAPAAASQVAPPQYESSEPAEGATVHKAPDRIEVTFDQPLDDTSSLSVTDGCDRDVDDEATEISGDTMSVGLELKPSGNYHVEYVARGLAGVTGENEGHFTFTAHGGESCDGRKKKHDHDDEDKDHHKDDDGHKEHDDRGHDDNGHDDMDHDDGDHGTGDTHDGGSGSSHTDHKGGGGHHCGGNGDHQDGDHSRAGSDDDPVASGDDISGITPSDTARELLKRADSTTLLISLALCVALGIAGGAVLRATGAK